MMTIATRLLRDVGGEEKPTVVMLVDRNELETQLFRNITAYGITTVQVAQSKEDLRRILRSDYRGLVVSMIHKFDRIDADMCPRANVVVLVDEAHRTTGGDLGNYLVAALPNATYIGFTGTPIDRLASGKGTFKAFGADDPRATWTSTASTSPSPTAPPCPSTTRWPRPSCGWTGRRWNGSSSAWARPRGSATRPSAPCWRAP